MKYLLPHINRMILLLLMLKSICCCAQPLVKNINMHMGSDIAGNSVVGPRLPYGSSHPSPDTKNGGQDGYSKDNLLYGFSQLHASGAGGNSHYGNFLLSPQLGLAIDLEKHLSTISEEKALPFTYECLLNRYGIIAKIVPSEHGATYKFSFPKTDSATILLDCGYSIPQKIMRNSDYGAEEGELNFDSDTTVSGWGKYSGGWLYSPYKVFFAISINKKPSYKGTFLNKKIQPDQLSVSTKQAGTRFGAWLGFNSTGNEDVYVHIAVSMKSINNAKAYLNSELKTQSFQELKKKATKIWETQLSKIKVKGGSHTKKSIFYSCLLRSMITPANRTGDSPIWDGKDAYFDDQFCVWDTWRTQFPLMALINQENYISNIQSFIKRFETYKRVDDAFIAGTESMLIDPNFRQGGDNVTNIIVDAFSKNTPGINWEKAYGIVKSQADDMRWPSYIKENKMYMGTFRNPASTQLEFCYNDYLAGYMAKKMGHNLDADKYLKRAESWEYLWNPAIKDEGFMGFIQNRNTDSSWSYYPPNKKDLNGPNFYEGSSWVYSYFVPHNFPKLIELCGGKEKYAIRLNYAFKNNLIDYSNEPSFLTIRSFIDAGRPDLCSYWVKENMKKYSIKNYPGDEDSGAMSSWYIFSALGVFPKAGADTYYLNAPTFSSAVVKLPAEKKLRIIARNSRNGNIYIKSVQLNGKHLKTAVLQHKEIINGGTLKFTLSATPTNWGQVVQFDK